MLWAVFKVALANDKGLSSLVGESRPQNSPTLRHARARHPRPSPCILALPTPRQTNLTGGSPARGDQRTIVQGPFVTKQFKTLVVSMIERLETQGFFGRRIRNPQAGARGGGGPICGGPSSNRDQSGRAQRAAIEAGGERAERAKSRIGNSVAGLD